MILQEAPFFADKKRWGGLVPNGDYGAAHVSAFAESESLSTSYVSFDGTMVLVAEYQHMAI